MKHSPACTALVMRSEGCVLKAYPDPASGGDPWTIGWGATGIGVKKGTVWSQKQADMRLEADLTRFDVAVTALLDGVPTTQGQFDALVDFAYNLGTRNLQMSTLLQYHRAGRYDLAAEQFGRWTKAAGKVMPGLVKRRAAEAALYRGEVK